MASLAYEVLWTRSLLFFLGLTTYTFTTILTTFLVGIALGSYVFSRFVDRMKDSLSWFGWIEVMIGISALAVIPLIEHLYSLSQSLRNWLGYYSWWGNVGTRFILSFVLILVPTFLMGGSFPIVVKSFTKTIIDFNAPSCSMFIKSPIIELSMALMKPIINLIVSVSLGPGLNIEIMTTDARKKKKDTIK